MQALLDFIMSELWSGLVKISCFVALIFAYFLLNKWVKKQERRGFWQIFKEALAKQLGLSSYKEGNSDRKDEARLPTQEEADMQYLQDNPEEAKINIRHRLETDKNNIFQHLSNATQEEVINLYHLVTEFLILQNSPSGYFHYRLDESQVFIEMRKETIVSDHQKDVCQKIKNASKKWHKQEYNGVVRYTLPLKRHGSKLAMDTQGYFNS